MKNRFTGLALLTWTVLATSWQTPAQALDMQAVMQPFQELTRHSTQQYTLAIMPLHANGSSDGERNGVDAYLEGALLQGFTELPAFQVLEREQIAQVLKEQGFSQSAYVSPEAAVSVGKMLGARLIITGHYLMLPKQVQLHLRLVDTESGRILKVIQENLPKDENLYALSGELTPEQRQAQEQKAFQDNVLNTTLNVTGALAKAYLDNQFPRTGPPVPPPQSPAMPVAPALPVAPFPQGNQALYFQDFSAFVPGTRLPQWGLGMVVRQSQRHPMHVLTTENPACQSWEQALNLPADFVLELHAYDQGPGQLSMSPLTLKLWSPDRSREVVIKKQGHTFSVGLTPAVSSAWQGNAWNVIALKKEGLTLTGLVNGQEVFRQSLSGPYWQGLRVESPVMSRWAFTRLGIYRP